MRNLANYVLNFEFAKVINVTLAGATDTLLDNETDERYLRYIAGSYIKWPKISLITTADNFTAPTELLYSATQQTRLRKLLFTICNRRYGMHINEFLPAGYRTHMITTQYNCFSSGYLSAVCIYTNCVDVKNGKSIVKPTTDYSNDEVNDEAKHEAKHAADDSIFNNMVENKPSINTELVSMFITVKNAIIGCKLHCGKIYKTVLLHDKIVAINYYEADPCYTLINRSSCEYCKVRNINKGETDKGETNKGETHHLDYHISNKIIYKGFLPFEEKTKREFVICSLNDTEACFPWVYVSNYTYFAPLQNTPARYKKITVDYVCDFKWLNAYSSSPATLIKPLPLSCIPLDCTEKIDLNATLHYLQCIKTSLALPNNINQPTAFDVCNFYYKDTTMQYPTVILRKESTFCYGKLTTVVVLFNGVCLTKQTLHGHSHGKYPDTRMYKLNKTDNNINYINLHNRLSYSYYIDRGTLHTDEIVAVNAKPKAVILPNPITATNLTTSTNPTTATNLTISTTPSTTDPTTATTPSTTDKKCKVFINAEIHCDTILYKNIKSIAFTNWLTTTLIDSSYTDPSIRTICIKYYHKENVISLYTTSSGNTTFARFFIGETLIPIYIYRARSNAVIIERRNKLNQLVSQIYRLIVDYHDRRHTKEYIQIVKYYTDGKLHIIKRQFSKSAGVEYRHFSSKLVICKYDVTQSNVASPRLKMLVKADGSVGCKTIFLDNGLKIKKEFSSDKIIPKSFEDYVYKCPVPSCMEIYNM